MTDHNHEHECCGGHGHDHDDHECCGGHGHEQDHHECCGGGHHHHDHDGCGCHDHDHGEDYQMIQLALEDGSEVSAAVLEIFELAGKDYIALLPVGEENVLLYEFKEAEEGIQLTNIETDEAFEKVSQAFLELLEFDEEDEEEE